MSADIAIAPALAVQATLPSRPSAGAPQSVTQSAALGASGPPPVNPGLHLDPALNIVVLQFYDSKGEVTQSIPSQKQLQAYQHDAGAAQDSPPLRSSYAASNLPAPS